MASDALHYTDLTPAPQLDKATLNKMVWRSLNLQASFNYERMQAAGWLWAILPGLEKIHTNKEDLSKSMTHNLEFFNTHPFLVTFVMGIVLSMEQQKADINSIRAVRVAAMGPLGGIGDALFWFTLVPVTAGITANMAIGGSMAGPILYFIITFGVQMALRYWLMYWSYDMGTKAIEVLTSNAREFTHAASLLGVFVVGAFIYDADICASAGLKHAVSAPARSVCQLVGDISGCCVSHVGGVGSGFTSGGEFGEVLFEKHLEIRSLVSGLASFAEGFQ